MPDDTQGQFDWSKYPVTASAPATAGTATSSQPQAQPPTQAGGGFDWNSFPVTGQTQRQPATATAAAPQDDGSEETWYNRPVSARFFNSIGVPGLDPSGEYRQGAGGVERAVEKFGSSLTSPLSLGLLLVTGGVGGVAEAGAAEAAGGVAEGLAGKFGSSVLSRLAPETAAAVGKAANTVSRLTAAGFSLQQVAAMATQYPQLRDAIKSGDYDRAAEMGTSMLLEGAGAAMTGRVAAVGIHAPGEPMLGHDKYITAAEQREVTKAGQQAKDFLKENKPLVADKNTDIAALLYHNAGGDVSVLEREQEALKDNTKLSTAAKQRVNGWLETAQNLPDNYKQLSAGLVPKYAAFAKELQQLGKLNPDAKLPENYGGQHSYAFDSEGDSNLSFNGRRPPGFLKERTFGDIFDAIHEGYEPNRGLASNYANYVREMGQVRGLSAAIQEGQARLDEDGRPVLYNPNAVRSIDGKPGLPIPPERELALLRERLKQPRATMPELVAQVKQNAWVREANTEAAEVIAEARQRNASPETIAQLEAIRARIGALADANLNPEQLTKAVGDHLRAIDQAYPPTIDLTKEPAGSTALKYYNQATGEWAPEIEAMHEDAANKVLGGMEYDPVAKAWNPRQAPTGVENPEMHILGGGTSSGKTTLSRGSEGQNVLNIDADKSKLYTRDYEALKASNPDQAAAMVHEESKAITRKILSKAIANKLNIIYDTTTGGSDRIKLMATLKNEGYRIKTSFVDIPVEEALKRAKERAENSQDPINFGRYVPKRVTRDTHVKAAGAFFRLKDLADEARFYDNSGPRGSEPAIIYERGNGKEVIHNGGRLEDYREKAGLPRSGPVREPERLAGVRAGTGEGQGGSGAQETATGSVGKGLLSKNGKLYYDMSDYKPGPDAFGKFYKYKGANDEGNRYFEKTNMMVHPEYRDKIAKSFQDTSWFRNKPLLQAALKTTTGAKNLLLSFSPFHWTTEYLRGIQMGLNPIEAMRPPKLTAESPAVTAKFGPSLGADARARQLMEEGTTGVVSKIPGIGKLWEQASNHLFGEYIPRLKAATWERVVDQLSKRHSNWSEDQVQFAASKIVDAAYGGLNWRQLGVDMTTRDALRLFMLAPDFTGSQLLFAKSAFEPGGSIARNSMMRIAAYNFMAARVLNMLHTGDSHPEQPFGVVSDDGKKVYSMRTMPSDIANALSDPHQFLANRLSPATKAAEEFLSGRDVQGKRIEGQQQVYNMLRNVLPIPTQSLTPGLRREDEGWGTSVARAAGFAPLPNRSAADTLAIKLASDRSESGPVNKESLEKHQKMIQMEDDLRTGAKSWDDLRQAYAAGEISKKDADAIIKNSRVTKNMEPGMIRLYTRATRLPMKDFLEVWAIATPQEREALKPLYDKKRQEYLRTAAKNLSPAGLAQDPLYSKLRQMHPNEPPW